MFRLGFPALVVFVGAIFAGLMYLETRPITGLVVDSNGEPVANAEVQLQKLFGEEMFSNSWRWKDNQFEPVFSDQNGRFLVPFPKATGKFRLVVNHREHPRAKIEVEMGEQDVGVLLTNPCAVHGEIQWDTEVLGTGLELRITTEQESEQDNPWGMLYSLAVFSGDPFTLLGLPAGKATLLAGPSPGQGKAMEIELDLEPGGGVLDLGVMDLRGHFKKLSLTIRDEEGEIIEGVWATSSTGSQVNGNYAQKVDMVFSGTEFDVKISAIGFRDRVVKNISKDQEITLQKGLPVELLFDPLEWFPDDVMVDIILVLQQEEESLGGDFSGPKISYYGNSQRDRVPQPGVYKVLVEFMDLSDFEMGSPLPPMTYMTTEAEAPSITVLEQEGLQSFQISIDESVVRDGLQRLRHLDWPIE